MKKTIIVGVVGTIGFLAIIFWIAFVIIAYRNEYLVFEVEKKKNDNAFLYYEDDGTRYYSYGLEKVYVSEQRFIFRTNKRELKEVIDDGDLRKILNDLYLFKNNTGNGMEYIYTSRDEKFSITRCELKDRDIFYIISDGGFLNRCKLFG